MSSVRTEARSPNFRREAYQTAAATIGELERGCRIIGLTQGQFSLLDLARAVIRQVGPSELTVSTWTTGIRDAENAGWLLENGELTSFRLLTDRSFPGRHPEYSRRILSLFGPDSIRVTITHAKFALIRAGDWRISIRSSMNLNRNKRWEQFDLDDSAEIFDFFQDFVDDVWRLTPEGLNFANKNREIDSLMARLAAGDEEVHALTPAQYAKHRGMAKRYVLDALRCGRISTRDDGLIDRDLADAEWFAKKRRR